MYRLIADFNMSKVNQFFYKYQQIADKSNDDKFFEEKYGHLGITSRKEWFIWKTEFPEEFEEFKKNNGWN